MLYHRVSIVLLVLGLSWPACTCGVASAQVQPEKAKNGEKTAGSQSKLDPAKTKDTAGSVRDAKATWKNDWGRFIAELSPYFKRGAPMSELKEKFEGQQVAWIGEIEEVSLNPPEASVKMKMPPKSVSLSDGTTTDVDYLHLSPKGENVKKWESVKAGTTIRFRTTLKGGSIFPVIALLQGAGVNAGRLAWLSPQMMGS
jgi:hypothetical protein